jgi:hypothetical protein
MVHHMIKKLTKTAAVLAALVGLVAAMALPSSATSHTVAWNGVRGLDSIGECFDEAGYLHWILTPGGNSSIAGAELYYDGVKVADGFRPGGGTSGAIHFLVSPYGGGIENVEVHAEVDGTAGRNSLLTISDGCIGGEEPPPPTS